MTRKYSELTTLTSFVERVRYLKLNGVPGAETFGYSRRLNQVLYSSPEWKDIRRKVIIRDNGCDLGIEERPISDHIYIHHINPITEKDILDRDPKIFDPENLICCSRTTHNAIHYGDEALLVAEVTERSPNDTCPWRK